MVSLVAGVKKKGVFFCCFFKFTYAGDIVSLCCGGISCVNLVSILRGCCLSVLLTNEASEMWLSSTWSGKKERKKNSLLN